MLSWLGAGPRLASMAASALVELAEAGSLANARWAVREPRDHDDELDARISGLAGAAGLPQRLAR